METNEFINLAVKKMFWAIGLKYSADFVNKKDWYKLHSWSLREEKRFEAWLIAEMRKEFNINKYLAKQNSQFFLLNYSWSLRLEK